MGWQVYRLPRNIAFPLDLYGFLKVSINLIHIPESKGEMQQKGINDIGCALTASSELDMTQTRDILGSKKHRLN